ncbi:MAG: hypothetical protein Q7T05_02575 [Dehalococcoidia bacterium]|nr:hypothetical protein [Dehalococcoidia bacterium]
MPRAKAKAKGHIKRRRRAHVKWLAVLASIIVVALGGWLWMVAANSIDPQGLVDGSVPRAAIIDELYPDSTNEELVSRLSDLVGTVGLTLDVYRGDQVTVDLYGILPKGGYRLIVIRSHSGAITPNADDIKQSVGTYLFTTEKYSTLGHVWQQLKGEVKRAAISEDKPNYFAIGPNFVTGSMKGSFDNALIILDGCSGLLFDDLAKALLSKGASGFLAWDATVRLDYVDPATGSLVKYLTSGYSIANAVNLTMQERGRDPDSKATLKYYPKEIGNRTFHELTKRD